MRKTSQKKPLNIEISKSVNQNIANISEQDRLRIKKERAKEEAILWAYSILDDDPHNVLYLDLETTGLPDKDPETQIVSIALLDGLGTVVFASMVNPHQPIPEAATAVHGLTQGHIQNAPSFASIGPLISRMVEGKRIVCYNAAFDIHMLVLMFQKYKIEVPQFKPECAMLAYSKWVGDWNNKKQSFNWHKLPKLAQGMNHSALVDCESTRLLVKMMGGIKNQTSPILLQFDEKSQQEIADSKDNPVVPIGFIVEIDPVPLVLVDFQVICWDIFRHLEFFSAEHLYSEKTLRQIIKAMWAVKLNRGPDMIPLHNYRVVVVSDMHDPTTKTYWRGKEILNDPRIKECWKNHCEKSKTDISAIPLDYKGSRAKEKPEMWSEVFKIGWEYSSKFFPSYRFAGFEADDWAGELYRVVHKSPKLSISARRQKFLLTIDRDWSGLVDSEKNIFWANTRYPRPNEKIQNRLASDFEVIEHTEYKLKRNINTPKELYQIKSEEGEFSDNLPPGSPLEYINLIEENPKYKLRGLPGWSKFVADIGNPKSNTHLDHYNESMNVLKKVNLSFPADLYPAKAPNL